MKEIVERILAIEREIQDRRGNQKLLKYNSGDKKHLKQIAFHKCPKKNGIYIEESFYIIKYF